MTHPTTDQDKKRRGLNRIEGGIVPVVSLVDRPAIAEPFVLRKAEGDMPQGETGTPAAQPAAGQPADPAAPAGTEAQSVKLMLPAGAKGSLGTALKGSCDQLQKMCGEVDGAEEAADAPAPREFLSGVMKVAMALGETCQSHMGVDTGAIAMAKADWTPEYEATLSDWSFLLREDRKFPYEYSNGEPYEAGLVVAEDAVFGGNTVPWLTEPQRTQMARQIIEQRWYMARRFFGQPGKEAEVGVALDKLAAVVAKAKALVSGAGQAQQPAATTDPAVAAPVQAAVTTPATDTAVQAAAPPPPMGDTVQKSELDAMKKALADMQVQTKTELEAIKKSLAGKEDEIQVLRSQAEKAHELLAKAEKGSPGGNAGREDGNSAGATHTRTMPKPKPGQNMVEFWKENGDLDKPGQPS